MNRKQLLIIIATVTTLTTGYALAGDIYRYTDADGNVHYGDRPSGAETETRLAIVSARSDSSRVQARNEAQSSPTAAPAEETASEEPTDKKMTRSEKIVAKHERDKKCASYRARMETLVTSRRLYREGENGEREYLDESQTQEARSKVQELIEKNCS